jgi:hypothetical protein
MQYEYVVVASPREVNELLNQGWVLYGPPFTHYDYNFAQALTFDYSSATAVLQREAHGDPED